MKKIAIDVLQATLPNTGEIHLEFRFRQLGTLIWVKPHVVGTAIRGSDLLGFYLAETIDHTIKVLLSEKFPGQDLNDFEIELRPGQKPFEPTVMSAEFFSGKYTYDGTSFVLRSEDELSRGRITQAIEGVLRDAALRDTPRLEYNVLRVSEWEEDGELRQGFQIGGMRTIYTGFSGLVNYVKAAMEALGAKKPFWPFTETYVNDVKAPQDVIQAIFDDVKSEISGEK